MQKTGIQYLDYTYNPIAMRCTPVSEGCDHCWHLTMAKRHAANRHLPKALREARAGGPPALLEDELSAPMRLRKPAKIGVQFMGDLFHEDVHANMILRVWEIVERASWHTFVVLTKRPHRLSDLSGRPDGLKVLPNVWLGVTAENQNRAGERVPQLLRIPAAKHWVSVEPMVEPTLMRCPTGSYLFGHRCDVCGLRFADYERRIATPDNWTGLCPKCTPEGVTYGSGFHCRTTCTRKPGIDWVVCGAETGPGARRMDIQWALDLRQQCKAAGVPFYFKQASKGDAVPDELNVREVPGEQKGNA